MKRCFELVNEHHAKFWTVEVIGRNYFATFGKIGAARGQTQAKVFGTNSEAYQTAIDMIREKTNKGYREIADTARHPCAPAALTAGLQPAATAAPTPAPSPPAPRRPQAAAEQASQPTHTPGPRRILTATPTEEQ